ncbi:MAG: ABC transporter transmembrane domain-containing protein, partial [Bosea sp. (in: a-proteobacteria)]
MSDDKKKGGKGNKPSAKPAKGKAAKGKAVAAAKSTAAEKASAKGSVLTPEAGTAASVPLKSIIPAKADPAATAAPLVAAAVASPVSEPAKTDVSKTDVPKADVSKTDVSKPGAVDPAQKSATKERKRAKDEDDDEDEDDDDDDDDDDDEDDDGPVNYTATEAVGAFKSVYLFTKPFLGPHRWGIFLVSIGLLVEMMFNVLMPLALKYLIDEVFDDGDRSQLIFILTVLGVAGLITSVVAIWYEWQDAKVTAAITTDVRKNLFDHIQKLPVSFYNRSRKGEVLSRFSNDMITYEEAVINVANWGVLPLLELVSGIILLLFLNWQLGLVALLIFPVVLIGPKIITPWAVTASYSVKQAQAGELGVVQENVGAQTVVKAFGLQRISRGWF